MGSQGSQKIGGGVETLRIHSDACLHACAGAGVGHSEGPGTHIECSRNSRHESSHGKDVAPSSLSPLLSFPPFPLSSFSRVVQWLRSRAPV